jgi:hypothetical protein
VRSELPLDSLQWSTSYRNPDSQTKEPVLPGLSLLLTWHGSGQDRSLHQWPHPHALHRFRTMAHAAVSIVGRTQQARLEKLQPYTPYQYCLIKMRSSGLLVPVVVVYGLLRLAHDGPLQVVRSKTNAYILVLCYLEAFA